jgi:hypothetical protein
MELTGVAEAARWEETRIPECLWEKWLTEATSGLNDWLGRLIHELRVFIRATQYKCNKILTAKEIKKMGWYTRTSP